MIVKSEAFLEKMPVSIVLFAAFIFYTFNAVTAGSPIFASDEYVYFISGKYIGHLSELYGLDPGLQRLSNLLFFHEVNVLGQLFGDHFVSLFRLVHSLEYVLAAGLLYVSAKSFMPKPHALMGLAAFLALPSHIYIYAVMPEVELILLSALVAFVLVTQYPERPVVTAAIIGFLVSIALLIKPHAVASLAALLVLLPIFNFLCFRNTWVRVSVRTVVGFLIALYIGVIGLWALMDGTFTFNPAGALGLTFYGKYIDGPAASVGLLTKLYQVMLYFVANFTVVSLLFLPVFIWAASLALARIKGHLNIGHGENETSPKAIILVLFAMLSIAAHLAMTAWFTAGAAILNAGEAQRIHGRYLGPALVAFPFLFFYSLSCLSQAYKKILVALTLFTLAVSYWFVSQHFKIYPWDNPLLFSFFNENNWYGWGFKNLGVRVGNGLYVIIFLGFVASLLYRHWQMAISSVVLCSILLVGCFQSYFWMYVHLYGNSEVSQAGRHFAGLIGDVRHGDGILVGHERYGRESYLLFNLASAPKVIDRPEGLDITPQDVAGYSWLITDGSYNVETLALPSVQVGSLKYYALKPSARIVLDTPKPSLSPANKPFLKPMSSLDMPLANMPAGISLQGFNSVEPWGGWTSQRTAVIELPVQLKGRIRIKLFAWALEQNLREGISLQVGDVVKRISVGSSGAEVEVDFDVSAETDRIVITSAVDRPSGSGRTLGVAIAKVSVEHL